MRKKFVGLWAVLIIGFVVGPADATSYYTDPVYATSEPGHATIFGDIYDGGTDFVQDGPNFHSADSSIWGYRVFDYDGADETIHIVDGDQTHIDQLWTDGTASVIAQAKHAANAQSFGWNQGGDTGGSYQQLLTDADIALGTITEIEITGPFLWGVQPNGEQWWSKQSENIDGQVDHLITYYIDGLETNKTVWLLFWEDLPSTDNQWDQDYQDFVVEVRAVPEPATIVLLGIGGLALLRKRRA